MPAVVFNERKEGDRRKDTSKDTLTLEERGSGTGPPHPYTTKETNIYSSSMVQEDLT